MTNVKSIKENGENYATSREVGKKLKKKKCNMSLEDYNKIRFSIKRTVNTFADSSVDDIKQLVKEFIDYVVGLDTITRISRCTSANKGLQRVHDKLIKENTLDIAECYKILRYKGEIENIKHKAENRHRGQKIAHRNRKVQKLEEQVF